MHVNVDNFVQPENTLFGIVVTVLEISNDFNEVQPLNVEFPKDFTPSGTTKLGNLLQPSKAERPNKLMLAGISIDVKDVHPWKL